MIPCVNETNLHTYLGSRQERLRERKLIHDVERQELGLHIESRKAFLDRQQKQTESASRLAIPFPRRIVERKAKHDMLDIRLAQRARQGPLPVDEEVAEENDILQKQIQRLRQTGVHLLQGGGNATLNSSAGFFGQGQQHQQTSSYFENNNTNNNSSFFLTGLTTEGGNNTNNNLHQNQTKSGANDKNNTYAGDVLFRPGRITQNLEPSEFWLYARQKVTQRTLGTQILQHPVVVGQGGDAESLKQLLLQSPIATVIRKKIANLLAQTVNRTRCGILFDLLSTKNIIVSGVPNVVGQIIYEHIADTIGVEHAALKFTFVGITDNSNCCAARDVFCQTKNLQGKNISGTKRGFDALDNVHTFAVAPPGGFETLLGPAAIVNQQHQHQLEEARRGGSRSPSPNKKKKKSTDDDDDFRKMRNQSSPLGMRPWHGAMKKSKPIYSAILADHHHQLSNENTISNIVVSGDSPSSFGRQQKRNLVDQDDDDDDLYEDDDHHHHHNLNNTEGNRSNNNNSRNISDEERMLIKKHKLQLRQLKEIEETLSPLPMLTKDDLLAAFDARDLQFLPHAFHQAQQNTKTLLANKRLQKENNNNHQISSATPPPSTKKGSSNKSTAQEKRWQESEMKHMNDLLLGPTVKLGKMTKRYNTQTPCATMKKHRMVMTPTTFTERPATSGSSGTEFERRTFSVGPGRFGK